METKLDVLITFYNQEDCVDKALESVFSQKCDFKYRVLIGDDGSNDGTLERVSKWSSRYPGVIQVFQMERNPSEKYVGGFRASKNRLNLLKEVKAPYFTFLDGDDYYIDNNKFQTQVDILDREGNSDCDACAHAINAVYDDGKVIVYPWQAIQQGKYALKQYWADLYFHTDTSIIRSSTIKNIPLDLIENNYNDNMITYLFLQNGKVYYIPQIMAAYMQTGSGIWTSGKKITNNIRNMFLYDLSIMINKNMAKETDIRFMNAWKNLYRERKIIKADELKALCAEAEDKNLKFSSLWLHYAALRPVEKAFLQIKYLRVLFNGYFFKLERKFFNVHKTNDA